MWATEAARRFSQEGPLVEVRQPAQVGEALRRPRGVVFIPDVTRLGDAAQGLLLQCLHTQEERPKIVVGVSGPVELARTRGLLREDLHYRLHLAQVDLNAQGMREVLAVRRAQSEAARKAEEAARKAEEERLAAERAAARKLAPARASPPRARSASRLK
ncbi:MAG TPA: Fis family transcriptional regulator, partial [Myxococcaceae bacterium]|nr:Fis family transcriptional regulator [Myxococcaceae bacterium]